MHQPPYCPLTAREVVEAYFLEHRAKLLDLAAFLDRVERAADGPRVAGEDFRIRALRDAIALLIDGRPERARRIQERLSDPSSEPLHSAAGMKGAFGAPPA